MVLTDAFHSHLVQVAIALLVAVLVQALAHTFIEKIIRRAVRAQSFETALDERKREDTLITVSRALFSALIWITAVFVILSIYNVKFGPLITGAGLFGVIFGFGAQNAIKDYLAGIYVLLENQYRVGDIVTMMGGTTGAGGVSGTVEEITLRITKLRNLDGTLSIVRNSDPGVVTNRTFQYAVVVVDITIDTDSDIDKVEKLINEVGIAMFQDKIWNERMTGPITFLRLEDFTDAGAVVKSTGRVKPAAQWDVAAEFRRRIKKAFEKNHINIAAPPKFPFVNVADKK